MRGRVLRSSAERDDGAGWPESSGRQVVTAYSRSQAWRGESPATSLPSLRRPRTLWVRKFWKLRFRAQPKKQKIVGERPDRQATHRQATACRRSGVVKTQLRGRGARHAHGRARVDVKATAAGQKPTACACPRPASEALLALKALRAAAVAQGGGDQVTSARIKSSVETQRQRVAVRCSKCHGVGHNKRSVKCPKFGRQ